jgi:uncharacterized protein (TIGR02996 family)
MKSFHPEELALLAAIHAEPRDDMPRLVYADWLDEHDDPRGEFIRLHVAWSVSNPGIAPPTRGKLTDPAARIRKLEVVNRRKWLRTIPSDIRPRCDLTHGPFLWGLPWIDIHVDHRTPDDFLNRVARWLCPTYQVALSISAFRNTDLVPFLRTPMLDRITAIQFIGEPIPDQPYPNATGGQVRRFPMTAAQIASVAAAKRIKSLRYVLFSELAPEALQIAERDIAPHVPTVIPGRRLS